MDEKLQDECIRQVWSHMGSHIWSQIWYPMDVQVIKNVDAQVINQSWERARLQVVSQLRQYRNDIDFNILLNNIL